MRADGERSDAGGSNAASASAGEGGNLPATGAAELTVAVAQFAPTMDAAANRDRMRELTAHAASRGAELVVFPEYSSCFTPQLGQGMVEAAEHTDGPFVQALAAMADEFAMHLVAGLVEASEDPSRFHNTIVALAPGAGVVATYRKQHLYDAFGASESRWVVPGDIDEVQTFETGGITVGMQTCYDIRFPEVSRCIADAGAELVLVPAEWVPGPLKEQHWRTLLAARAMENTVYVAGAGQTAPGGIGRSVVIDPMGVEIAALAEHPDVALAPVSSARVAQVRAVNPSLASRRYRVLPA